MICATGERADRQGRAASRSRIDHPEGVESRLVSTGKHTYTIDTSTHCVRVFVSSTFQDMHEERDALGRVVFPYLRKYCRRRGLDFVGVDLRWGITEEQAKQGVTVGLCFQEIDRCRPYFIGILGDRYGWVPTKAQLKALPYLKVESGCSITELEIRYGALDDETSNARAHFYFRSPRQPQGQTADAKPEPVSYRSRLALLKDRIRRTHYSLLDGYGSVDAFSERVTADLCASIDRDFPDDAKLEDFEREQAEHRLVARVRCSTFIGRSADMKSLSEHAMAEDATGPLLVTGDPGIGKSSLLAYWSQAHMATHPDDVFFLHFVGGADHSTSWDNIALRMIREISARFKLSLEPPGRTEDLFCLLPRVLSMAAARGRRIILVLDGLDRMDTAGDKYKLQWLPAQFPPNVRVIISLAPGEMLDQLRQRDHKTHAVRPLSATERDEFIDRYLARYSKALCRKHKDPIMNSPPAGNPLYLNTLLNELRLFGTHKELADRIAYYTQARDTPELMRRVLLRLEHDYDRHRPGLVEAVFSFICAARWGLTESELLSLLGDVPQAVWAPLHIALEDMTLRRNGVLTLTHAHLRSAVHAQYDIGSDRLRTLRRTLADWFSARMDHARAVDELPWLLRETASWDRLYDVLRDPDIFYAIWVRNRYEALSLWAATERNTEHSKFEAYSDTALSVGHVADDALLAISMLLMNTGGSVHAARILDGLIARHDQGQVALDAVQRALGLRGNIYHAAGQLQCAESLYKRKLDVCDRTRNQVERARALGNIGLICFAQHRNNDALEYFLQVETVCEKNGDVDGLQRVLGNIGNVYARRNDDAAALEHYERQERLCRDTGNTTGLLTAIGCQGVIHSRCKDFERAVSLYRKQEELCGELDDLNGMQMAMGNLGATLLEKGDADEALHVLLKRQELCERIGDPEGVRKASQGRADALVRLGRLDEALALLNAQVEALKARRSFAALAETLLLKSNICKRVNLRQESTTALMEAQALAQQHGLERMQQETHAALMEDTPTENSL